jgi:hypothetical protein
MRSAQAGDTRAYAELLRAITPGYHRSSQINAHSGNKPT